MKRILPLATAIVLALSGCGEDDQSPGRGTAGQILEQPEAAIWHVYRIGLDGGIEACDSEFNFLTRPDFGSFKTLCGVRLLRIRKTLGPGHLGFFNDDVARRPEYEVRFFQLDDGVYGVFSHRPFGQHMMVLSAEPINDPQGTGAARFIDAFDQAVTGDGS